MTQQNIQKVSAILEGLLAKGEIDKTQFDIYLSKYSKAYNLLVQATQNERVHGQNISDLTSELTNTEQLLQQQNKKIQSNQQRIFSLRQVLQQAEQESVANQENATVQTNKLTQLGEEKMLLEQQIALMQKEKQNELEPKNFELQQQIRDLEQQILSQKVVIKQINDQIQSQNEGIANLQQINQLQNDEIRKLQGEQEHAQTLPDKHKRQAALMKQGQQQAKNEFDKRSSINLQILTSLDQRQTSINNMQDQIASLSDNVGHIKNIEIAGLHNDIDNITKQMNRQKFTLQQIQQAIQALQQTAQEQHVQQEMLNKGIEQLNRKNQQLTKQNNIEQVKTEQKVGILEGLKDNLKTAIEENQIQKVKNVQNKQQTESLQLGIKNDIIDLASKQNQFDINEEKIQETNQQTKNQQKELYKMVEEMQMLSIETVSLQSQRQHSSQKLAKLQGTLRSLINQIQIKDMLYDKLAAEKAQIDQKIALFKSKYEKIKTDKNKLQRLSQEAKLAIQEVDEKIGVLRQENEVLTSESTNKQLIIQRQIIDTKEQQRQAMSVKQQYEQAKIQLRQIHEQMTSQIQSVKQLGEQIVQRERQIYQLKENYIKVIEVRNLAGQQLIQRNDDLSKLFDKLHTQQAILREAEQYLNAREDDVRTLTLLQQELMREKELVQQKQNIEYPELVAERDELINQVSKIRAENEQILNDIRSTAAIRTGNAEDDVQILKLDGLYNSEVGKSGTGLGSSQTVKKPPQILGREQMFATWNMVGSAKSVDPKALSQKQQKIESFIQQVSQETRDKLNLDDELEKMIRDLEQKIEERKNSTDMNVVSLSNEVRQQLQKVNRQLLSTAGQIQLQQMTCLSLEQVAQELGQEVTQQRENVAQGQAPSEELEHEWLVQRQNLVEYQKEMRMRRDLIMSQAPGVKQSTAKKRYDSYIDGDKGLPKPYGSKAPLEPRNVTIQMSRFVKQPKRYEIDI